MANTTRTDEDAGQGRALEIEIDDQYRALADEQRRALLGVFEQTGPPVTLDVLAVGVAARTEADEVDDVRLALHHKHLPRLDDVGVLEYDSDDQRVTACHATLSQRSA